MQVHTTAKDAPDRVALMQTVRLSPEGSAPDTPVIILVNPSQRFQTVLGIGVAITDASIEVFAWLPPPAQAQLLKACFDPEAGIGYTLLPTTIHSSDFASASTTDVAEGDTSLSSLDLAHDPAT